MVGGTLTSNGTKTILGAVLTGLNVKLGISVPTEDPGNGNNTFQYNSCYIASALQNLGSLQRVSNGWVDHWPSW